VSVLLRVFGKFRLVRGTVLLRMSRAGH